MKKNFDEIVCCGYNDALADKAESSEGGVKYDANKLRYDLVPVAAFAEVVKAYTEGCNKYGERNWEKGISASRLYAAAQRHLNSFWDGEDHDKDSGLRHLASAAWNILGMLHFNIRGEFDDRPKGAEK